MAEISIEEMKSLVNDGVVGASEFTEWISARACKFACDGDLAALSLALDEGADPNLADDDGKNPLIYAAKMGHEHCVARLLEAGADPNCAASGRESVLMFAACSGHALGSLLGPGHRNPCRAATSAFSVLLMRGRGGSRCVHKRAAFSRSCASSVVMAPVSCCTRSLSSAASSLARSSSLLGSCC